MTDGVGGEEVNPFVGVVILPERAEEGLRMASALPLGDNDVEVIILGSKLPDTDEVAVHLDSLEMEEVRVRATFDDPRVTMTSSEELRLLWGEYDHVVTF